MQTSSEFLLCGLGMFVALGTRVIPYGEQGSLTTIIHL
jgi:hypothetical protein